MTKISKRDATYIEKIKKEFSTIAKKSGTGKKQTSRNYVDEANKPVRLNKYLADAGIASRRKADELIAEGVVKVNGMKIFDLGTKVKNTDTVTVNGDPVTIYKNDIYIILNKPKDTITTTSDDFGRKTVMDIVKKRARIFPVGRLDRATTGALLMTNDGELANRLTHPSYEIEREYNVTLDKALDMNDAKELVNGVELEEGKTKPCYLFIIPDEPNKLRLVLTEGKNREVRKMFEHFGYEVRKLDRKLFAGISTKGIKRGEYRHLDRQEIVELKKLVKIKI
jgi:23S rRNA pseudouridine2605 synthase